MPVTVPAVAAMSGWKRAVMVQVPAAAMVGEQVSAATLKPAPLAVTAPAATATGTAVSLVTVMTRSTGAAAPGMAEPKSEGVGVR